MISETVGTVFIGHKRVVGQLLAESVHENGIIIKKILISGDWKRVYDERHIRRKNEISGEGENSVVVIIQDLGIPGRSEFLYGTLRYDYNKSNYTN